MELISNKGKAKLESGLGDSHSDQLRKLSQGKKYLFPIPKELRDKIYEVVLTLPNCLISEEEAVEGFKKYGKSHCSRMSHTYPLEVGGGSPFDLSILLTSKITYMEAYPIFYKVNTIYFRDTSILLRFLTNIGPARRHALTHVGFDWTGKESVAAFRMLKTCPNLKTVRFTFPTSTPTGYHDLRQVRGLDNVMRLTKFIWNENYGRTVLQWCTEEDEDILPEDIENEDDMDIASERRVPAFEKLKAGMMRPKTEKEAERLGKMMEKALVLGGSKK